jgi:hypothetical protein
VRNKGDELDSSHMQFSNQDRLLLTKLMLIPESREQFLPMRAWLSDHGVTLVSDVKVTEFVFRDPGDEIVVTGLKYVRVGDGGQPARHP